MLSSSDDSMQGVTGDSEQPDYPVQPVTPGEEELMRIHEDGGYCPPDMIEMRDHRGLAAWFAESVVRNREVLSRPYTLDSVSEVEALLVDSEPEDEILLSIESLLLVLQLKRNHWLRKQRIGEETAKIVEEAADKPTVNVEAAADKMMPELKDDLSSYEQSVPGQITEDNWLLLIRIIR